MERLAPRKIAVVAWGRLGDSICRLTLLRCLKEAFPEAELTALVEKPFLEVFSGAPYIDRIIPCDVARLRKLRNFPEEAAFLWRLRRERFDGVFDPWGRKRSARYTLLSGAPLRFGIDLWRKRRLYYNVRVEVPGGHFGESVHLIDHGLLLLRAAGISCEARYEPIAVEEPDRQVAEDTLRAQGLLPGRTVVFNLGADGREKRWPVERFAALAEHLISRSDCRVAVLRNPDMPDLQDTLMEQTAGRVSALPMMSIKQLAALAALTDMLVSGDTGPLHIWQAMSRPAVVTASLTHPSIFRLPSSPTLVLHHPEACVPAENCNWRGCTREQAFCMDAVTVEEVAAACDEVLDGTEAELRV